MCVCVCDRGLMAPQREGGGKAGSCSLFKVLLLGWKDLAGGLSCADQFCVDLAATVKRWIHFFLLEQFSETSAPGISEAQGPILPLILLSY